MWRCPECHWRLEMDRREECPACGYRWINRVLWRARRAAPRVQVRLVARARVVGGSEADVLIRDLSATGARWWAAGDPLARPRDAVWIEIRFPGRGRPLTIAAGAVWTAVEGDGSWCGLRFYRVPDAGYLARFIAARRRAARLYRLLGPTP